MKRTETGKGLPELIIGLDAGSVKSALVAYQPMAHEIVGHVYADNKDCLMWLDTWQRENALLAIEQFKSYGNLIGDDVLWSCVWNGRFCEMWNANTIWLPRKTIVANVCGKMTGGDKAVRRAMLDSFPKTGGGNEPSQGTTAKKGPLFGIVGDKWSALAVAITARIKYKELQDFL